MGAREHKSQQAHAETRLRPPPRRSREAAPANAGWSGESKGWNGTRSTRERGVVRLELTVVRRLTVAHRFPVDELEQLGTKQLEQLA